MSLLLWFSFAVVGASSLSAQAGRICIVHDVRRLNFKLHDWHVMNLVMHLQGFRVIFYRLLSSETLMPHFERDTYGLHSVGKCVVDR